MIAGVIELLGTTGLGTSLLLAAGGGFAVWAEFGRRKK